VIVVESIDPTLFAHADLRAALAGHDIGALYRALQDVGVSQRRIAALTGQSQSEVSEIVHGREVNDYRVLVRIGSAPAHPLTAARRDSRRERVVAMTAVGS
jgi:hypothetical protein